MTAEAAVGWFWHSVAVAGSMTWEILRALSLGFALPAAGTGVAAVQVRLGMSNQAKGCPGRLRSTTA